MNRLSVDFAHRFSASFALEVAFETATQVTALVGPSGAGKTSVLYAIAGLLRPQRGVIRLGDETWLDAAQGLCLHPQDRHVGLVFQDHLLFPHLSVQANLLYGYKRRSREVAAIEPARVVQVLELAELLNRYPKNLSGGEKQRVALGRSLLSGPRLLLMDEPLAALDEPLKDRILNYVERVLEEWRVPTIYVSHNAAEVRRLAERVVVMEQGRVVQCGAADEVLLTDYSF